MDDKPTVRVYCQAKTNFSLSIRDGILVYETANASDLHQHWIKDEKFGINVKDEEGFTSFALVNKATGQAMNHFLGEPNQVQLTKYQPDKLDNSILWSMGKDSGDGYRSIRPVNNINTVADVRGGVKKDVGMLSGTEIILWSWYERPHQKWIMESYNSTDDKRTSPVTEKYNMDDKPTLLFSCQSKPKFFLSINDGEPFYAPANDSDLHQYWIKDEKFDINVKDEEGNTSFALINKATGEALKHAIGVNDVVQLTKYNPDKMDKSILWSLGDKTGRGVQLRPVDNIQHGIGVNGREIISWKWDNRVYQKWNIVKSNIYAMTLLYSNCFSLLIMCEKLVQNELNSETILKKCGNSARCHGFGHISSIQTPFEPPANSVKFGGSGSKSQKIVVQVFLAFQALEPPDLPILAAD
ncbi:ricin B-like lectin R40G2 [Rutidosis leptorrhynchoides]|uniref:ricin B-like lectin R40G2 n=1 Tax=Rutidosis leptorrhynchoides TaxID=125765 RepID=UPI003A9A4391